MDMKTNREVIIVLDANFVWTEELFTSATTANCDVLLLKPKDFRSYKKIYGHYRSDWAPIRTKEGVWEQKLCMPPGWLFHFWPLTELYLLFFIKQFMKRRKRVSLVVSYPHYHSIWKRLRVKNIYYCFDMYDNYWSNRKQNTQLSEHKTVELADLVICTSKERANYLSKKNPECSDKIKHISHGTGKRFLWKKEISEKPPKALSSMNHPIAGYIGGLNYRFDFIFFYEIAQKTPDVTFVLGGTLPTPSDGDDDWYKAYMGCTTLPNIHFLGYIPNKELPSYLGFLDVLILPYAACEFNTFSCPMKLWDYMGTQRPIVANTSVPEVRLWQEYIYLADNPDEFVACLRQAVSNPTWQAEERYTIAQQNTWEKQFYKISLQLNNQLDGADASKINVL